MLRRFALSVVLILVTYLALRGPTQLRGIYPARETPTVPGFPLNGTAIPLPKTYVLP